MNASRYPSLECAALILDIKEAMVWGSVEPVPSERELFYVLSGWAIQQKFLIACLLVPR